MPAQEAILTVGQAATVMQTTIRHTQRLCSRRKIKFRVTRGNGGKQYRIMLSSLPEDAQRRYWDARPGAATPIETADLRGDVREIEVEAQIYANAPEWQRRQADKYKSILDAAGGAKGEELRAVITKWNLEHPDQTTSYPRVIEARKRYCDMGVAGLLAQYGKRAGSTQIDDDIYNCFKTAYLKEGGPSGKSCWMQALGLAQQNGEKVSLESFPSVDAFLYRLKRELPADAIYRARYGYGNWNRKYGPYVKRDYSSVLPGECIVSDHAQVDVGVLLPNGKYCFPWVTVWRDYKSGKWLGWMHHAEAPNSDHIFQAFYYAVRDYGLPTDVIIDNGKDYRSKDFAGGRTVHKLQVNSDSAGAMLSQLNITPHFALPYNAQTKPIERDFLRNKVWFSMHMPGYRGGNVTERPEVLKDEIKGGQILTFDKYCELMDSYIIDVANKMPSQGDALAGRCADECWETEHPGMRRIDGDALKLFCTRTSRDCTIGRNGVRDSDLQITYYAEWMVPLKGEKVYMRRDIRAYNHAWVFRAEDHEFLGTARLAEQVAALARTDIEKAQLQLVYASKKRSQKITASYLNDIQQPSADEKIVRLSAGIAAVNESRGYKPGAKPVRENRIALTRMDRVLQQEEQMQATGTDDISSILPPDRPDKPKIYLFKTDRDDAE
jgi:hypothetical protein